MLHVHTPAGVAVSAQKGGLLPISQQSTIALASLGYHDYEGIALRDDEKPRLVRDLGDKTSLILRNHGLLTVGPTIADAFLDMFILQRACEIQVLAQSGGGRARLGRRAHRLWREENVPPCPRARAAASPGPASCGGSIASIPAIDPDSIATALHFAPTRCKVVASAI